MPVVLVVPGLAAPCFHPTSSGGCYGGVAILRVVVVVNAASRIDDLDMKPGFADNDFKLEDKESFRKHDHKALEGTQEKWPDTRS